MSDQIYFQWQNEVLLKTIYPLREMKLRDFLVYFREIDLWTAYKDKSLDDVQDEVQAYLAAQAKVLADAVAAHTTLREYFLGEDFESHYRAKFPDPDPEELRQIVSLHDTFKAYFPRYQDVRKEKYFVSERLNAWEWHRKGVERRVASQQRQLHNMLPEHPNRANEEAKLARLQNFTLAMVEEEYEQLRSFLSTFKKIETRKLELQKERAAKTRRREHISIQLQELESQMVPLEKDAGEIAAELARLKNPPDLAALESYFLTEEVSTQLRAGYPKISDDLLTTVNAVHKALAQDYRYSKSVEAKAGTARTYFWRMREVERNMNKAIVKHLADLRNMPENWTHRPEREATLANLRDTGLKVVSAELEGLTAFQSALLNSEKSADEIAAMIESKEREAAALDERTSALEEKITPLRTELAEIKSSLAIPDEEKLTVFSPETPVTVRDIVEGKVTEYKLSLEKKDHFELLEDIVALFMDQPERFPLWVQYMVIHFSGMRYASAHGSWADPKDLLINLRTSALEKDFTKLDDAAVDALVEEKLSTYSLDNPISTGAPKIPPRLALTSDPAWREKIAFHLRGLGSLSPYYRRRALFNLRVDEEDYEVESISHKQALDALEAIKDTLPEWMWKEIVKLTELRVTEAKDPNWEKLTPEEEQESYASQWNEFRQIMNKWKMDHITDWREEHDRANRLIVTRAVCNEVAEHIQHLRGHSPPGGLTAKAPWYLKNEHEAKIPGDPPPYFTRPKSIDDYTVGASVLWLRFVEGQPNAWRIAKALVTKDGDRLIPDKFLGRKPDHAAKTGSWIYDQSDAVRRRRVYETENKKKIRQEQWLRWIHEATVVDVVETADGPTILTFETALPYEDPRLSTIGVFKHSLDYMLSIGSEDAYNGSFVGYVPEYQLPVDDLEEMLDWNKILRKQVLDPAEMENYRETHIRRV